MKQVQERLQASPDGLVLLDCRNPDEQKARSSTTLVMNCVTYVCSALASVSWHPASS